MKRLCTLLAATCLSATAVMAQPYAEVSVKDIMTLPADSINAGSLRSPLLGDTVWVTGIVTVPPVVDPIEDRRPILWAGSRWVSFLRDTASALQSYAGINILQADTSSGTNTLFDRARPGNIIKALVKISNFPTGLLGATQVEIIKESQIEFADDKDVPTMATPVSVSDFYTGPVGGQTQNFQDGSKYVGMQVELTDVTVVSLTQFDYVLADKNGNEIYMRSQSGYFSKATETGTKPKLRPDFEGYKVGQTFTRVRGYITSSNTPGGVQSYMITPVYVDDVTLSEVTPPEITSLQRDLSLPFPSPQNNPEVTITVQKGSSDIALVKVSYSVDGGVDNEVSASPEGSATYIATIPAQPAGSLVRYKAIAIDNNEKISTYPLNGTQVYRVLDRPAKISDVREQFNANGSSSYQGYTVTLEGVITTDPSDIAGANFTRMYMQDGTTPYSGVFLITNSPDDAIRTASRGDRVKITGTVAESGARTTDFHITALSNITSVEKLGTVAPVDPVVLSTASFSKKSMGSPDAEQWESMLVEFQNVVVVDTNADTGSNFGEFLVADESNPEATMRVEVDDSNISITNNPNVENKTQVSIGQKFPYLRGIMFYSFGNYKLVPRNDQDFEIVTSVAYLPSDVVSTVRAFPNPFAGETTVECELDSYAPRVLIRVVDVQGRTVYTSVQNNLPAGTYRFALNGSALAAGTYRCTVETAGHAVSTQLIVVQ